MNKYFVSYFAIRGDAFSFGRIEIIRRSITEMEDIEEIEQDIAKDLNDENILSICIISWQLFERK